MDFKRGVRKFVCKRCGKNSHDEYGYSSRELPDGTRIEEEFIDLCKKCFKKSVNESRQTIRLREAIMSGECTEEDITEMQKSSVYKRKLYERLGIIRTESWISRQKKKLKLSPSSEKRKEKRKILGGMVSLK